MPYFPWEFLLAPSHHNFQFCCLLIFITHFACTMEIFCLNLVLWAYCFPSRLLPSSFHICLQFHYIKEFKAFLVIKIGVLLMFSLVTVVFSFKASITKLKLTSQTLLAMKKKRFNEQLVPTAISCNWCLGLLSFYLSLMLLLFLSASFFQRSRLFAIFLG